MSYLIEHLTNGWQVDQAIKTEESCVVVIRFGRDQDPKCIRMDEILAKSMEPLKNFVKIYLVDIDEVPDFNQFYELTDPMTLMFFHRNKHIQIDCGTGNNNKINFDLGDAQEFKDLCEVVYRGASKGRGLVHATKDYSTQTRY